MTTNPIHTVAIAPSAPPSTPRLVLAETSGGKAVLNGGWWPRSWDPEVELPGLILALGHRYGPIRSVMLNKAAWHGQLRRLTVGGRRCRLGWYVTLDPALMIATTEVGVQLEMLVVPPSASATTAQQAMATAADPANTRRAPDLLGIAHAAPVRDPDPTLVWANEGGAAGGEHGPARTPAAASSQPALA
jgi:Family of unknown function (DUF5994)